MCFNTDPSRWPHGRHPHDDDDDPALDDSQDENVNDEDSDEASGEDRSDADADADVEEDMEEDVDSEDDDDETDDDSSSSSEFQHHTESDFENALTRAYVSYDAASGAAFRELCLRLRRNDPDTLILDAKGDEEASPYDERPRHHNGSGYSFPGGYGMLLGDALAPVSTSQEGNTTASASSNMNQHVSSLKLHLNWLLPSGSHYIGYLARLLHYIKDAPALRRLHLTAMEQEFHPYPAGPVFKALLKAAAESEHLEELEMFFEVSEEPYITPFCTLLQTTQSLRAVHVYLHKFSNKEDRARLVQALAANQTLQRFHVSVAACSSKLVDFILARALTRHLQLQELSIRNRALYLNLVAIPVVLMTCLNLRCLELWGCNMDSKTMKALVEALMARNETLERLMFRDCHFDSGSVAHFLKYCRMPMSILSKSNARPFRELSFQGKNYYCLNAHDADDLVQFYSMQVGPMAANLLVCSGLVDAGMTDDFRLGNNISGSANNSNVAVQTSIPLHQLPGSWGSSLERLVLDLDDYSHFWATYVAHAEHIRLRELALLGPFKLKDWQDMATYLPHVSHLQDLSVRMSIQCSRARDVDMNSIVQALRGNTSLHRFQVLPKYIPYCTPDEQGVISSLLRRNQE